MSKKYTTIEEVMRALLDGKKLTHVAWGGDYIFLENGKLFNLGGRKAGIHCLGLCLEEYCPPTPDGGVPLGTLSVNSSFKFADISNDLYVVILQAKNYTLYVEKTRGNRTVYKGYHSDPVILVKGGDCEE